MKDKIKIGISSCLLGEYVRYDGSHKLDHYLKDTLGQFVAWVPVCPEVESGLPVPREAMHLTGNTANPRLVTRNTGIDHTDRLVTWSRQKLIELKKKELCGFIFKSRSPSSGMRGVKVYTDRGIPSKAGIGIFAREFMNHFFLIPVEDDGRLHDPGIRENFIERVFVFKRWNELLHSDASIGDLLSFHTDHKLLIMSHSPKHLTVLGKTVADAKKYTLKKLYNEYIRILMDGLRFQATVKKNVNVLHHIVGYFKKYLLSDEKTELLEIIENYHKGFIPLIVPVTLLKHYVRKYNETYLKKQYYLNPHPVELMLRNHV